jgi:hypothetical protein
MNRRTSLPAAVADVAISVPNSIGAQPAQPRDLPIERASEFDLLTGLTIPPALLLRADRVIE